MLQGNTTDTRKGAACTDETGENPGARAHLASHAWFLPFTTLRTRITELVGLACMMSWVELLFCFEGVLRDKVELAGGLVHDPLLRAATLTAAAAFALAAWSDKRKPQPASEASRIMRPAWPIAAVGGICSAAATLLAGFWPTAPIPLPCLAGVGAGVFIAWGTLSWGTRLATCDLRAALLLVSAAACLQWLPLLIVPTLPAAAQAAIVAMLAIGTCLGLADDTDRSTGHAARQPAAPDEERPSHSKLGALAGMVLAFSAVIEFMWCFFIKMLPGRLGIELFPLVFACVIVATALVMAACLAVMERQRGYRLELYYRLMMLFCLCGVAATGVAAPGDSPAQQFAMYTLVYLGYSLSGPTLWLLSLGYVHMRRTPPAKVLSCVFACKYLGLFCGFSAVDVMGVLGVGEAAGPALVSGAVLVCVAVLGVAYLLVFPERDLLSLSPLLFGLTSESLDQRCRQIAAEHCLTPRETEVFTLLARGRDVGFICEELCISRNTANAHRKAIFSKLGIHSQQELLDAVEEGRGGD